MAEDNAAQSGIGLPVGTRIGKYTLVERLKIGGQGVVYKAHEASLDRDVAIKQISPHLAENPGFVDRFREEAKILARLGAEQPAIVTIHELIEDPRGLFIVMEYVPGSTLEQVLADQPNGIEPKAALQILWRLAAALHTVHAAGIIHRDIKPANIIVGEGLRVKIADFGVAARSGGNTSMLLGTTKYMAPELFDGEAPCDQRVDMYSLGLIAYELLAGRERFGKIFHDIVRDPHTESLRWMKWHGDPDVAAPLLHEINPAVPEAMSHIVAKMMAKKLDERFESMEALGRTIKSSFSPRTRAQGGSSVAAPMTDADIDEVQGIPDPSDGQSPPPDSADGPATAVLPKKHTGLAGLVAKVGGVWVVSIVLFLMVAGVLTALTVRSALREKRTRTAVQAAFDEADRAVRSLKWAEALASCKDVQERFPGTPEAAQASVIQHYCQGNLAVIELDFAAAAQAEDKAQDALRQVQREHPGLRQWAATFREVIDDFKVFRRAASDFRDDVVKVRQWLDQGDYDRANTQLDSVQRIRRSLSEPLVAEMNHLRDEITLARFQQQLNTEIARGRGLANEGKNEEARESYKTAISSLNSKAAGLMPADKVRQTRQDLEKKIRDLTGSLQIEQADAAVRAARTAKDKDAEIVALQRANTLRPSLKYRKRIEELRAQIDMERAKSLMDSGNKVGAMKVFRELLKRNPDHAAAAALLKGLEYDQSWWKARREADRLFEAEKWPEAMAAYKKAVALRPDQQISSRATDCEFNIQFAKAEALDKAGEYPEAIVAYEKARNIRSHKNALISQRQSHMRRELEYRGLLGRGDLALADKDWTRALEQFKKARRVRNTAEVSQRIKKTQYLRFVDLGDRAMAKKDFRGARASYLLAKGVMETPEIKTKVRHAETLLEAQEP